MARIYQDVYETAFAPAEDSERTQETSGEFQEILQRQCEATLVLSPELQTFLNTGRPQVIVRLGS